MKGGYLSDIMAPQLPQSCLIHNIQPNLVIRNSDSDEMLSLSTQNKILVCS